MKQVKPVDAVIIKGKGVLITLVQDEHDFLLHTLKDETVDWAGLPWKVVGVETHCVDAPRHHAVGLLVKRVAEPADWWSHSDFSELDDGGACTTGAPRSRHESQDGAPPWGKPQPAEELEKIHARWLEKNCTPYGPPKRTDAIGKQWDDGALLQCGGCMYYVPLEGSLGMDWGACTNPRSPMDGKVTMEHHGCMAYNNWDLGAPLVASDDLTGAPDQAVYGAHGGED